MARAFSSPWKIADRESTQRMQAVFSRRSSPQSEAARGWDLLSASRSSRLTMDVYGRRPGPFAVRFFTWFCLRRSCTAPLEANDPFPRRKPRPYSSPNACSCLRRILTRRDLLFAPMARKIAVSSRWSLKSISRAGDFQADEEGSIPFNRSSLPVVDLLCRQRSSARILAPNHNG